MKNVLKMTGVVALILGVLFGASFLLPKSEAAPEQRLEVGQKFELELPSGPVTVEVVSTELVRVYEVKDSNGGEGIIEQDELLQIMEMFAPAK